jgi:zinc transport system substrate-binding protein
VNTQTKLAIIAIVVVIPLTSIAVYSTNSNQQYIPIDNSKLQVISSFNPLHEFSQIVGQDKVDVRLLVPVGVEPHDWEPTIKDVQEIQKSDLIIINGIGFENWVDNLAENNYQGIIIDTSNGISINNLDQENTADPHIWLNPVYAKKQVQNIELAFSNYDPENGKFYHANAVQYSEKLD